MKRRWLFALGFVFAATIALQAERAQAQEPGTERPPTGLGGVVAGSVLTGLGVLNLAYTPLCFMDGGDFGLGAETCMGIQLGAGGLFVAVGVPVLIAGGVRRSRYKEWVRNNQVAVVPIVAPDFGGLALAFTF